jgi:predicted flap endonuclease-1-like 5' DNA nuclease
MTLREAADYLKAAGWPYEIRAAGAGDIVAGTGENRGKVVRQEPAAAAEAGKTTTVRFWVDLGSMPVQEIDGIGDKIGENLLKAGIRTVGDLSLADVEAISSLLRISDTRARNFVDMAGLMSADDTGPSGRSRGTARQRGGIGRQVNWQRPTPPICSKYAAMPSPPVR